MASIANRRHMGFDDNVKQPLVYTDSHRLPCHVAGPSTTSPEQNV